MYPDSMSVRTRMKEGKKENHLKVCNPGWFSSPGQCFVHPLYNNVIVYFLSITQIFQYIQGVSREKTNMNKDALQQPYLDGIGGKMDFCQLQPNMHQSRSARSMWQLEILKESVTSSLAATPMPRWVCGCLRTGPARRCQPERTLQLGPAPQRSCNSPTRGTQQKDLPTSHQYASLFDASSIPSNANDLLHVGSDLGVWWLVDLVPVNSYFNLFVEAEYDHGVLQISVGRSVAHQHLLQVRHWMQMAKLERYASGTYPYRWLTCGFTPKEFIQFRNVLSSLVSPWPQKGSWAIS